MYPEPPVRIARTRRPSPLQPATFALAAALLTACSSPRQTTFPPPHPAGLPQASIPEDSPPAPPVPPPTPVARYTLAADARWLLTPPFDGPMDASGLLRLPDGTWLTVNDKGLPLYEIRLGNPPEASLRPRPDLFPAEQMAPLLQGRTTRFDPEGLSMDAQGRILLCEEGERWVLRHDPATGSVERLDIDWFPVRRWFHPDDRNASLEGIAMGDDRLYVANERESGRIIVVDPETLRVVDDFQVLPAGRRSGDIHYSGLCWHEGHLWVLCRNVRTILQYDPQGRRVVAQFDYQAIETAPENAYATLLPFGMAEGLWVDATHVWVVIDNNGFARRADRRDRRPLLFRCPRPDR